MTNKASLRNLRSPGFTLIELLVVLAIVAVLASLAVPRYFHSIDTAKETVLAENLRATREVIDKFYGDTGRFPESLDELVEKQYLKALPWDPVGESNATWVTEAPLPGLPGAVANLRSGSAGTTRDGRPFSEL